MKEKNLPETGAKKEKNRPKSEKYVLLTVLGILLGAGAGAASTGGSSFWDFTSGFLTGLSAGALLVGITGLVVSLKDA